MQRYAPDVVRSTVVMFSHSPLHFDTVKRDEYKFFFISDYCAPILGSRPAFHISFNYSLIYAVAIQSLQILAKACLFVDGYTVESTRR